MLFTCLFSYGILFHLYLEWIPLYVLLWRPLLLSSSSVCVLWCSLCHCWAECQLVPLAITWPQWYQSIKGWSGYSWFLNFLVCSTDSLFLFSPAGTLPVVWGWQLYPICLFDSPCALYNTHTPPHPSCTPYTPGFIDIHTPCFVYVSLYI